VSDLEALILTPLIHSEEKHGELADLVYADLFAAHPEYLDFFVLDSDGGVRRSMMRTCMDIIVGYAQGGYDEGYLYGMRLNHEQYGLADTVFDQFFEVIEAVAAREASAQWTPETAQAWADMRADFLKTKY
jgi:hypothetical protein